MKNSKRLPMVENLVLKIGSVLLEQNPNSDLTDLYAESLRALFDIIQNRENSDLERAAADNGPDLRKQFCDENPGDLYEYLRNFRLRRGPFGNLELESNVAGRRNQGLFYTPDFIVDYIVTQSLEGFGTYEPWQYMDCMILDPAAGTGKFLEFALLLLTKKIFAGMFLDKSVDEEVRRRLSRSLEHTSIVEEIGIENSIKIHLLNNCLYGVELDPIAARIAEFTLLKHVSGVGFPVKPNIGNGNALIGEASPSNGMSLEELNKKHADLCRTEKEISEWAKDKKVFHWESEFPAPFKQGGFDAVIGNPPYEIYSVKESGIKERSEDQKYFKRTYRTCKGKINAYRLMLERGIDLLKPAGILGFIVPATVLADSSAVRLRRLILDETELLKTVIIPEKAKIFEGVTQALSILIMKKGAPTKIIEPIFRENSGSIPSEGGVRIPRSLLKEPEFRIPLLRTNWDLKLMETLGRFPTLASRIANDHVHQGEINLTVHRKFITDEPTGIPLVRGEHIFLFRLSHPFPKAKRLDWLRPEISSLGARFSLKISPGGFDRPEAEEKKQPFACKGPRVGIARVVNLDTHRRLKAALIPEGFFMGDMTNYIHRTKLPTHYLLGLLNSRLLNKRLKLTSTNNYISAAEIESLPVPAPDFSNPEFAETNMLKDIEECATDSISASMKLLNSIGSGGLLPVHGIEHTASKLYAACGSDVDSAETRRLFNLLDALVVKLYKADSYAPLFDDETF